MNKILKICVPLLLFSVCGNLPAEEFVHWYDAYVILKVPRYKLRRFPIPYKRVRCKRKCILRVERRHWKEVKDRLSYVEVVKEPAFKDIFPEYWKTRKLSLGYKSYRRVVRWLIWFRRKHPRHVRLLRVGKSWKGRTIWALRLFRGRYKSKPNIYINAAHHGNEVLSIEYALDVAQFLVQNTETYERSLRKKEKRNISEKAKLAYDLLEKYNVYVVPVINSDGLERFWTVSYTEGRKNARKQRRYQRKKFGVDLNRNYPFMWNSGIEKASSDDPNSPYYRGKKPASEPETKAIIRFAKKYSFVFSVSFHTYATKILIPYTINGLKNPVPDYPTYIAERIVKAGISYREEKEFKAVKQLYPVDGTDQDWLFHTFGTLAYIYEGSHQNPPWRVAKKSIHGMRLMMIETWKVLLDYPVAIFRTKPSTVWKPSKLLLQEKESWRTNPKGIGYFFPALLYEKYFEVYFPEEKKTVKLFCFHSYCKEHINK
ncbi:MAG: hypothetical protein D6767_10035 [Candidatus Hydrogenedentota bacterium]|nr:MAG: hypothetical protein D6767_10035 [Candidatus Hydrogenedentota bacterium]